MFEDSSGKEQSERGAEVLKMTTQTAMMKGKSWKKQMMSKILSMRGRMLTLKMMKKSLLKKIQSQYFLFSYSLNILHWNCLTCLLNSSLTAICEFMFFSCYMKYFRKTLNNKNFVHDFVLLLQLGYCKFLGICGQNPNTLCFSHNCCYFLIFATPARLKIQQLKLKLLGLMS